MWRFGECSGTHREPCLWKDRRLGVSCVSLTGHMKGFTYASIYSDPSSDPSCGVFHGGTGNSNFWILRFWFLEQAPASHG